MSTPSAGEGATTPNGASKSGNATTSGGAARDSLAKTIVRVLISLAMIAIGITHFTGPEPFVRMVPAWLPAPLALVYVSGAAEIAGGLGLFLPTTRRAASLGLVALYIAVFPANVNMALNAIPLGDYQAPSWALWARLPFQIAFIALALWVGRPPSERRATIAAQ